ncbi:MAG: hypothetical protein O7E56_05575 [SAR324 cluster bacterium]|nr:hypothetical protein [SAR324 cluster bacterium]
MAAALHPGQGIRKKERIASGRAVVYDSHSPTKHAGILAMGGSRTMVSPGGTPDWFLSEWQGLPRNGPAVALEILDSCRCWFKIQFSATVLRL